VAVRNREIIVIHFQISTGGSLDCKRIKIVIFSLEIGFFAHSKWTMIFHIAILSQRILCTLWNLVQDTIYHATSVSSAKVKKGFLRDVIVQSRTSEATKMEIAYLVDPLLQNCLNILEMARANILPTRCKFCDIMFVNSEWADPIQLAGAHFWNAFLYSVQWNAVVPRRVRCRTVRSQGVGDGGARRGGCATRTFRDCRHLVDGKFRPCISDFPFECRINGTSVAEEDNFAGFSASIFVDASEKGRAEIQKTGLWIVLERFGKLVEIFVDYLEFFDDLFLQCGKPKRIRKYRGVLRLLDHMWQSGTKSFSQSQCSHSVFVECSPGKLILKELKFVS